MKDTRPSPNASPPPEPMKIPAMREILEYSRRLGWRRALFRGAYVATNQLMAFSVFDCFRLRREDVNMELATANDGYECRFVNPDEAGHFARQLDGSLARMLPEAMAIGDDAYVILDDGRLASIGFYAKGPTPILNDLMVHFDPPARYMYRGYTKPAYRGRRLHALGILRAALDLFDRGVPQLVTVCERTNYPATISVFRMGWQPAGFMYRAGIGPWMRLGRTAAAKAIGMRLQPRGARPDA